VHARPRGRMACAATCPPPQRVQGGAPPPPPPRHRPAQRGCGLLEGRPCGAMPATVPGTLPPDQRNSLRKWHGWVRSKVGTGRAGVVARRPVCCEQAGGSHSMRTRPRAGIAGRGSRPSPRHQPAEQTHAAAILARRRLAWPDYVPVVQDRSRGGADGDKVIACRLLYATQGREGLPRLSAGRATLYNC